jgi:hypothetical protein
VKLKVALVASGPEFQATLSLVVVCIVPSRFVHFTVSPMRIVRLFGEKAKPLILTMTV